MNEATLAKFPVVVGVDFTERSAYAVQEALQLARHVPRIELNFVHVVAAPADLHDANLIDQLSERMSRTMTRFESFVRDVMFVFGSPPQGAYELAFHTRVGVVSKELHQVAVDTDAEMIIVGADKNTGLRRIFHRTAVSELLKMAHVPVVVAHPKDFRGLSRSAAPEPARPGQDLLSSGMSSYSYVDFRETRSTHVSGMI
jgi:nucleotide-binding universal stress UspA family protein